MGWCYCQIDRACSHDNNTLYDAQKREYERILQMIRMHREKCSTALSHVDNRLSNAPAAGGAGRRRRRYRRIREPPPVDTEESREILKFRERQCALQQVRAFRRWELACLAWAILT